MNSEQPSNLGETELPDVVSFFDKQTCTFTYLVRDKSSHACAVIDPVLNFNYASGKVSYAGANDVIAYIERHKLNLEWIIETHVHADHITSAPYIKEKLGGKIAVGEKISTVQQTFGDIFNEDATFSRDGSQFDHLFTDEEVYTVGDMKCSAFLTPGHTPACMVHVMGDAVFVGDTLFMPDAGTARADFPGGDAATLYDSVKRIMSLPSDYRIFVCHDYQPNNRQLAFQSSVEAQRKENVHVKEGISKNEFVKMREGRDKTLDMPGLILPSLQINMRAGYFPKPEDNDTVYLKIPLNKF